MLGGGSIAEHNNGSFRALNHVHDVGLNFAVFSNTVPASEEVVLSLYATTGATVQGALSASGNCTVGGALRVQGIDVLALAQGKRDRLAHTSQLHVDTVKALIYQSDGSEFYFWTASNTQLLKLSPQKRPSLLS